MTVNASSAEVREAGINFFDTADVYSYGESETVLGQALKDCRVERDKVMLATKVRSAMSEAATAGTGDVTIAVIEKAAEFGFHSCSGAVLDPRAIAELLPDYREMGCPIEADVVHDEVWYLHENERVKAP